VILLALLLQEEHVASPFDINGGVIIWTVIIFLILLGILYKMGYPALLKMVEEREQRIQKQLEDAEKANAEAQRLLEEHKKQIAAARTEAQEILAKAKTVSQKERETLLAKAREEYDALLARARKDIDAENRIYIPHRVVVKDPGSIQIPQSEVIDVEVFYPQMKKLKGE